MKHSILRKLMLIAVLLTSSQAFAHDFEVDGIYYNITSETDKTVEVTFKGDYVDFYDREYTGNVRIPESVLYNGSNFSVTSIGNNVFESCDGLTSITIPKSVVNIGDYALHSCDNLNTIVIESGNARYDSRENCNAIIETATNTLIQGCNTTIIPNSVKNIFKYAFSGCIGLASVNIPNSVTSIGDYAFCECYGLTLVTIGNSVTIIGESAFDECSGLASVTIGNSVASIGKYAFSGCSSLASVTIPNSVTSIGNGAFSGCSSLASVAISNSVTSIGNGVFSGCSSLASVTIPNSVISIGESAFYGCSSLASVTIPNSVTSIGIAAFVYCSNLASVTIGNSVTSIGIAAFVDCSSLDKIICENVTPPTANSNTFAGSPTTATLYVPAGSKDAYTNAAGWSYFTNIKEIEMQAEPIVTIMDASNQGSVSFSYEEGKAFEFKVTPAIGYIVNTVLVNGEEISSNNGDYKIETVNEETIISVSYEIDPATGVNTLNANNLKVYGYNETLTVAGTEFGDTISIYDLNGAMLKTQNSVGSTNYISIDNGVYIVKVNGKSFKVML